MSGSELEGQRRELFGDDIDHCDICGAPVPSDQLIDIEEGSPLAENGAAIRICSNCLADARKGEIDIASFVAPEDERRERGDIEW